MASSLFLFSISLIIVHLSLTTAQQPTYVFNYCNQTTNYSANRAFQSNLKLTLSSLLSNATRGDGFYNTSTGQSPDVVYGLFQCRFDVSPELCQSCIKNSSETIMSRCPSQREAIIWYEECTLSYADRYIFSNTGLYPQIAKCGENNITVAEQPLFSGALTELMNDLIAEAVSGNSSEMFAAGNRVYASGRRLYGLVQCTPDISQSDCQTCLSDKNILPLCDVKQGGSVVKPSCSIRYDWNPFYNETAVFERVLTRSASGPPPPPPLPQVNANGIWIAVGSSVSAFVAVVLLGSCTFYIRRTKRADIEENSYSQEIQLLDFAGATLNGECSYENLQGEEHVKSHELPLIHFDLINTATNHFSHENKLGEGGFGPVYKVIMVMVLPFNLASSCNWQVVPCM